MGEIHRLARETGEPVEVENAAGEVTSVISVPGPLPPEPIDKVRALLENPPKPTAEHVKRAQELSGYGLFGELVGLLALLDAIRETAREP